MYIKEKPLSLTLSIEIKKRMKPFFLFETPSTLGLSTSVIEKIKKVGFLVRQVNLRKGSMPEWLMGADCKSAGNAYAGSNPARPKNKKKKRLVSALQKEKGRGVIDLSPSVKPKERIVLVELIKKSSV